jgi:ABC-type antimicrobial peptide transport system permease subunit
VPGVILAVIFALMVGFLFGWYPARRAARLDPIEAISGA